MTEHPILFSGPMVCAILHDRKTMTRRIVKPQPVHGSGECRYDKRDALGQRTYWWGDAEPPNDKFVQECCPYGQPGDRLYVRHAFNLFPVYFKPIDCYEGIYAAGTDGQIYRVDQSEPTVLRGTPTSKGYLSVSLSKGGVAITRNVHVLICEAFYGPKPSPEIEVRHVDGDQLNNLPGNLDWGTGADNWADRKRHKRGIHAEHHAAKLTPAEVGAIRSSGKSQRALAKIYGVSQSTIGAIKTGVTWSEPDQTIKRNLPAWKPWGSSIHMPRWASRITLEITGVRVERLNKMSDADILAEGVESRNIYVDLWNRLNSKRGYSWESNCWVWVLEFRKV